MNKRHQNRQTKEPRTKEYWFESVKFHDPNYPIAWFAPVFSKKIIATIFLFWLCILYLPWEQIAQLPFFPSFIELMNEYFPSIDGLPPEARHGGEAYSKAQLSTLHFCAVLYLLYALLRTGSFPVVKQNVTSSTYFMISLLSGLLFMFCLGIFTLWNGRISASSNGFSESEWKLTGTFILFWYGTTVLLVVSVAAFKTCVSLFYKFIRK